MHLVGDRGAGCIEARDVHADQVKGPAGRAIAAGPATPHILMRVDEALDLVFSRLLDDRTQIREILLVVLPWAGVLDRLPGGEQAQERQAPRAQAAKMLVGFFKRKRPADERDVAVLEKTRAEVGRAIWPDGDLVAAT